MLLGSNTIPSLQNLYPKDNYLSSMPRYIFNSLSKFILYYRRVLESAYFNRIMCYYNNCVSYSKEYKISSFLDSYIAYTSLGLLYKLIFSKVKLYYIYRKRYKKLEATYYIVSQIQELVTYQSRLYTKADNLKKQEEELVCREL